MIDTHGQQSGVPRHWLATLAVGVLGLAGQPAHAAVAGAWETFWDAHNSSFWAVFNYADGQWHAPLWSGTPINNEYVYYNYVGDKAIGFNADSTVGPNAFTGDYGAQKIAGIALDAYIGDLAVLDNISCLMYAKSTYGVGFYAYVHPANEFTAGGWQEVYFDLSKPWQYFNGTSWVSVPATTFTDVEEIQINFTPKPGSAGGSRVGIDNVVVEPTVAKPTLSTSVTGAPQKFRMAFTPGPGLKCRIEKMKTPPASGWDTVTGQTDIKGPGEYVFLRPLTPPGEIFRVAAEPAYTMIVTP